MENDIEEPDYGLGQLHRVLTMMLEDFISICNREGLQWYAMYGTAIGALREKGFVPWDEDIDICMPRDDLESLCAIVNAEVSDKYAIINANVNPAYPMMTTRMMLKGTKLADKSLLGMDFESMVFLDLFPLDNLSDDESEFKRQVFRSWFYNKIAMAKLTKEPYVGQGAGARVKSGIVKAAQAVLRLSNKSGADFNAMAYEELTRLRNVPTKRVGFTCDTDRTWNLFTHDQLEPARTAEFEGIQIRIPYKTEELLTRIYGDFMTPPPPEQRNQHYPEILDLGTYAHL